MRFSGQVVLVTGGTGGMGESHVRAYHAAGARVVIGSSSGSLADARRLAAELGDHALAVPLDVTSEPEWSAAVAAAEEHFGGLTILVNNAGVQNPPVPVEATDLRMWERTFAVNVTGQFLGIRAVTPALRRAGGGVIVNVGSTMAYGGTALYAAYVAGKWAIRGLTASAALELARDGIRVNTLHPGVVATKLITVPSTPGSRPIADFYDPAPFAVPRLGTPADMTAALLYMTSPEASFLTGTDLVVDGGLLLGPALPPAPPTSSPAAPATVSGPASSGSDGPVSSGLDAPACSGSGGLASSGLDAPACSGSGGPASSGLDAPSTGEAATGAAGLV